MSQTTTKTTTKTFKDNTDEWFTALEQAQEFLKQDYDTIDFKDIPTEWNW